MKKRKEGAIIFSIVIAIILFAGVLFYNNSYNKKITDENVEMSPTSGGDVYSLTNQLISLNGGIQLASVELRQQKITQMKDIAVKREILMLQLAKENPYVFLDVVSKSVGLASVPVEIQQYIEKPFSISASVDVMIYDDFANNKSWNEYTLNLKGDSTTKYQTQKLEFYPTRDLNVISGTSVSISGYKLQNVAVANVDKNLQVLSTTPLDSIGDQKTLVLLVDFLDSGVRPFTKEQGQELIFGADSPFQKFYHENSYGKVSFSGDVMGWYQLQRNINSYSSQDTQNIIKSNGIDLTPYSRVVVLLSGYSGGFSSVGRIDFRINENNYKLSHAVVGGLDTAFSRDGDRFVWNWFYTVLAHEMGHSLGVFHAKGWDCDSEILYGNCHDLEYGNYFDVMGMGSSSTSLHFNAYFKEILGWIDSSSVLTITQSGRYSINPLETTNGIKFAKIKMIGFEDYPFYLEYRKGIGYDSGLNNPEILSNQNGLMINNIIIIEGLFPFSRLLDMSPHPGENGYWYFDSREATLNLEQTFSDTGSGISINPISNDNSQITFDVNLQQPICVRNKPYFNYFFPEEGIVNEISRGALFSVSMGFINQDSIVCGNSDFSVLVENLPNGWTYEIHGNNLETNTLNIKPRGIGRFQIYFSYPDNVEIGDYPFNVILRNLNTGELINKTVNIKIVSPPIIESINPSSGLPGIKTILTVSGVSNGDNGVIFYSYDKSRRFYIDNVPVSKDGKIEFEIPREISYYDEVIGSVVFIPTTPGEYLISIYSNKLLSNSVLFTVPFDSSWCQSHPFYSSPTSVAGQACCFNKSVVNSNAIAVGDQWNRFLCYNGQVYVHDGDVSSWWPNVIRVSTSCDVKGNYYANPNYPWSATQQEWMGGWKNGSGDGILCNAGKICSSGSCVNIPSLRLFIKADDSLSDGIASDSSGMNNNAFCSGTTCPSLIAGKYGSVYSFNGGSNYLRVSDNSNFDFGNNSFTISLWVKETIPTTQANRFVFANAYHNVGPGIALYGRYLEITNGNVTPVKAYGSMCWNNNASRCIEWRNGQWHHLVYVMERTSASFKIHNYYDGQFVNTNGANNLLKLNLNFVKDLIIGNGYNTLGQVVNNFALAGSVDEFRVYDRALNSTEIQGIYSG
ncbi:MAG: LamG-like jellyroll fold domain-containing protein [Candidatus Pacearchaeota archaeon]